MNGRSAFTRPLARPAPAPVPAPVQRRATVPSPVGAGSVDAERDRAERLGHRFERVAPAAPGVLAAPPGSRQPLAAGMPIQRQTPEDEERRRREREREESRSRSNATDQAPSTQSGSNAADDEANQAPRGRPRSNAVTERPLSPEERELKEAEEKEKRLRKLRTDKQRRELHEQWGIFAEAEQDVSALGAMAGSASAAAIGTGARGYQRRAAAALQSTLYGSGSLLDKAYAAHQQRKQKGNPQTEAASQGKAGGGDPSAFTHGGIVAMHRGLSDSWTGVFSARYGRGNVSGDEAAY